jgi:hypothetical protein
LASLGALALAVGLCAAFPEGYSKAPLRDDAEAAIWLLAACGVWAALARKDARWAAAAVALFLADVAVQTWDSPEIGEASAENHALDNIAASLPKPPNPRRLAVLLNWGDNNNATFAHGWEGVTGYGPTPINTVLRFIEATWRGSIPPLRPLNEDENFPRFRTDSPLTPLFASPVLATNQDASVKPLVREGDLRVYRLPSLPRVFWTAAWRAVPDEFAAAALRTAARGTLAVLPLPLDTPSGAEGEPVAGEQIEVRANSLDAEVTAPSDGLAVILDPYYPGWSATVDGAPAKLLRADVAFSAVQVSKGRHRLHLAYFPDKLLPGILVAAVAAALLVLLCKLASQRVDTRSPGD